jgi:hypothetical protein
MMIAPRAVLFAAALGTLGLVARGQNLQSGQVFSEPPAPDRDPARELAMKTPVRSRSPLSAT